MIIIHNFIMIFIHDVYKFIPTYRLTLSGYPTRETIQWAKYYTPTVFIITYPVINHSYDINFLAIHVSALISTSLIAIHVRVRSQAFTRTFALAHDCHVRMTCTDEGWTLDSRTGLWTDKATNDDHFQP